MAHFHQLCQLIRPKRRWNGGALLSLRHRQGGWKARHIGEDPSPLLANGAVTARTAPDRLLRRGKNVSPFRAEGGRSHLSKNSTIVFSAMTIYKARKRHRRSAASAVAGAGFRAGQAVAWCGAPSTQHPAPCLQGAFVRLPDAPGSSGRQRGPLTHKGDWISRTICRVGVTKPEPEILG